MTGNGQAGNLPASAFLRARTNWAKFHRNDRNNGYDPYEKVLSPATVSGLTKAWSYLTGGDIDFSSPAVVNGVVYVGSDYGRVYAVQGFHRRQAVELLDWERRQLLPGGDERGGVRGLVRPEGLRPQGFHRR